MNAPFLRAMVLIEQSRHELAEKELHKVLAEEPNNATAHAWLALCLANREEYQKATAAAETAVHLAPDQAFAHYALGKILLQREHLPEAEAAIAEAIRLDPLDPDFHACRGAIYSCQKRWDEALSAVAEGLRLDAEHVQCSNLRAMALRYLGRNEEAGQSIAETLAREPEDALAHANMGWNFLEQNDPDKALDHFREALRLDPELRWAQTGVVEALKARHLLYRVMLRYFLSMEKLSRQRQWLVILGIFFGYQLLRGLAQRVPDAAPYIWPFLALYIVFVIMSWIAKPLFNLLLRFNRFGRLSLSREQIAASNWIGACLLLALVLLIVGSVTGRNEALLAALVAALLVIPVAGAYNCESGWPRSAMALYTIGLAVTGFPAVIVDIDAYRPAGCCLALYILGMALSPWVANGLSMVDVRK